MSDSGKPAWSASGAFPFMFPLPGATPSQPTAAVPGLTAGMDLLKNFWGALPGSTQVPGFLVPTIDVEELDKRIADLHAAESWVEVNLNMLRATIQGLEVQRNTIAALKSMAVMPDAAKASPQSADPATTLPGAAAGQWLGFLQSQFTKVAEAALAGTASTDVAPRERTEPKAAAKTARKHAKTAR